MPASVAKRHDDATPDQTHTTMAGPFYSKIVQEMRDWTPDKPMPLAYVDSWAREVEQADPPFMVPKRIPYGCWHHAAPPGGYKSAFAAQLEHHIAYGRPLPGPINWESSQRGDCLVITPDESFDEIQERSLRITPGGQLEHDGQWEKFENQIFFVHVPRGGNFVLRVEWLWALIAQLERETGRKIVWVRWDTIGNLIGDKDGADAYSHAQPLQKLNFQMTVTKRVLFLPNHIGTSGRSIGSVNYDACSNLATEVTFSEDKSTGVLKVRKMRGGPTWERSLVTRGGLLELDDMLPQQASMNASTLPGQVVAFLATNGPSKIREILVGTHIAEGSIWTVLRRLRTRGAITNVDGCWQLVDKDPDPAPAAEAAPPVVWRRCPVCNKVEHTDWGCDNMSCERWNPARPQFATPFVQLDPVDRQGHEEGTPTDTPDNSQPPALKPLPRWKQMSGRKAAETQLPQINAAYTLGPKKRKVWEVHPITAAVELIMGDRDAGRLTPRWRLELPEDLADSIDGMHGWGEVPSRYEGKYRSRPDGPARSYDIRGSFLASYKTLLPIKELEEYSGPWTRDMTGACLIRTPEWQFGEIVGHPLGMLAVPGELQWVWQPSMRLLHKLSEAGKIQFPDIEKMYARKKSYQESSENLLVGFQRRMQKAREHYTTGIESEYVKLMYSAWLSSAEYGRSNVFKRADWTNLVRAEAFGRVWAHAYSATERGISVLAMGNTDEVVFRTDAQLDQLFPQDKVQWGKLKIKDEWS